MTKRLEELFNLPTTDLKSEEDDTSTALDFIKENEETIKELDIAIDKIDTALPAVKDLEASDKEMDELAKLAQESFEELMSLGMNVEARYSGAILQTAGTLLGHAIAAKQAKIDKKLRMIDLQLKKARLDKMDKQTSENLVEGKGVIIDRNTLLAEILNKNSNTK
ncbi:MAG: hypothetical protein N2235_02420 [Fischerella sp.]|nr:hypothetical protein [Fischerella sp.]